MKKVSKKLKVVHIHDPADFLRRVCGKRSHHKKGILYGIEVDRLWDPNWDGEYRRCIRCWSNPNVALLLLKATDL